MIAKTHQTVYLKMAKTMICFALVFLFFVFSFFNQFPKVIQTGLKIAL